MTLGLFTSGFLGAGGLSWMPQYPDWQILMAFGFGPLDPTPLWTDITDLCINFDFEEGRQHELDRTEAGQFTATFDDRFGMFTPNNTLSPFYNLLTPGDALGLNTGSGTWVPAGSTTLTTQTTHVLWGPTGGVATGPGSAGLAVHTGFYAVNPLTQYTANIQVQAQALGEAMLVSIQWYDSGMAFISSSPGVAVVDANGMWSMVTTTGVSPSNAAFANVWLDSLANTSRSHYFTCVHFCENQPVDWSASGIPTVWNQGQFGPLSQCSPMRVLGTWSSVTEPVAYCFSDSFVPDPSDQLNQETSYTAVDILGLLAQAPISNSLFYPAQIMSHSPALYWRLGDPVDSATAADNSGNGNVGSINTSAPVAFGGNDVTGLGLTALFSGGFTGSGSGALIYDPTSSCGFTNPDSSDNAILSIPNPTTLVADTSAWSIEFLLQGAQATDACIFEAITDLAGNDVFAYVNDSGQLQLQSTAANPTPWPQTAGGPVLTDGNWHHIVITCPAGSGTVTAYIDGVSAFTLTQTRNTAPSQGFIVGGESLNNVIGTTTEFPTLVLQDLAVFPSQLSSASVTADYDIYHYLQDVEFVGARIEKVLQLVGFDAFPHSLAIGTVLLAGETSSQTQTAALGYIQTIVDVELGFFWQDPTGFLQFKDAMYPLTNPTSNTPQVTVGDNAAAGANYEPGVKVPLDSLDLYTDVQVQAQQGPGAGKIQEVENTTAIGPPGGVGRRPLQRTGLPFASDVDALTQANTLLARYSKTGVKRVDAMTLKATNSGNIPQMLARQLWEEVRFQRQGSRESLYDAAMLIEKRTQKWDAPTTAYEVDWVLSPYEVWAAAEGTFILDDPKFGVLTGPDHGTVVAYGVLG